MSGSEQNSPDGDGQVHLTSRHERVTTDEEGQRIDNFLLKRCHGVPRSHIYRLIRKGDVRVDGRRVKQTRKLLAGEQVRIPAIQLKQTDEVRVPDKLARAIGSSVILEHDNFLVLNKPQGIAVHGGSGLAFGLIDALRQQREEPKLELAHRLDRATSGCLLIGKGLKATRALQNLFRERTVEKRYLALVDGQWPAEVTSVDAPLLKNAEQAGERRVTVDPGGQQALTHFTIRQCFKEATLLDILLDTGRTHQIRVHTRHSGHAIVGDQRYGDNRKNQIFRQMGLGRLFLHSSSLSFEWGGEKIQASAPVGPEWVKSLNTLQAV